MDYSFSYRLVPFYAKTYKLLRLVNVLVTAECVWRVVKALVARPAETVMSPSVADPKQYTLIHEATGKTSGIKSLLNTLQRRAL